LQFLQILLPLRGGISRFLSLRLPIFLIFDYGFRSQVTGSWKKRGGCEIASTLPASEIYRVALLDLIVHVHLGSTDSMTKSIRDSNMPAKNIEWAFFN